MNFKAHSFTLGGLAPKMAKMPAGSKLAALMRPSVILRLKRPSFSKVRTGAGG